MVAAEFKRESNLYGWYVVFINAFIGCVLSAGFPQSSMTIPYLADKMGVAQEILLSGDTVKTIGIIVAMMISGFLYKKIGAKAVFIIGMATAVAPQFIIPYINSVPIFITLKFIQGLSSIVFPVFLLIIMDWIDESQTGLSTAVFTGIFYGGGGIGGTFAGYVITKGGWAASYWALGILQLIVAALWLITVREKQGAKREEEKKTSSIPFSSLIRMPMLWLLVLSFLSTTWTVQAITVDMSLYGAYLGYGEMETGSLMSAITIGIIAACIVSGKASDFFAARCSSRAAGRVGVLMAGSVIIVASAAALIMAAPLKSFTVLYAAVLMFSFGGAWGLGCFYSTLPEIFDGETLPVATGFIGGCGDAGMTFAPVAVGIICGMRGLWAMGWSLCAVVGILSILACVLILRNVK